MRPTIMLVDDEPAMLAAYRRLIERRLAPCEVLVASNGREGLMILRRRRVDLLVVDYRMPDMDGVEFLHEARKVNPRIPRVLLTAYPDAELERWAAVHGHTDDFISKAVHPEALVERLARLLARPVTTKAASR